MLFISSMLLKNNISNNSYNVVIDLGHCGMKSCLFLLLTPLDLRLSTARMAQSKSGISVPLDASESTLGAQP